MCVYVCVGGGVTYVPEIPEQLSGAPFTVSFWNGAQVVRSMASDFTHRVILRALIWKPLDLLEMRE